MESKPSTTVRRICSAMLGDARELGGSCGAGCVAGQDHARDTNCDIEQEREAGDPCVRCARHVSETHTMTGAHRRHSVD
jgi:hypothetical protein